MAKSVSDEFCCDIYVGKDKKPQIQEKLDIGYFLIKNCLSKHGPVYW